LKPLSSISVVIPTFGRPAALQETLESIARTNPLPAQLLIVDGDPTSSGSRVVDDLAILGIDVQVLRAEPGVSHQRNVGVEAAQGEVIVFLDDDVLLESGFFGTVEDALADDSLVAATGKIVEPQTRQLLLPESAVRRLIPGGGREGQFTRYGYPRYLRDPDTPKDVEFMGGCLMCVRREAAAAVGFDEQLALAEDEDFAYRLSRLGRIRYDPRLTIYHRKLGFLSRDRRRFERKLLFSRLYIFRKNFPQTRLARAQFAALVGGLVVHRLLNREFEGARGLLDAIRAMLGKRLDLRLTADPK